MSTYLISGKLGTGKTKSAVRLIQMALAKKLRVATNLDLNLEHLTPDQNKMTVLRIPDKPTVADLEMIGIGNDSYDEDQNGIIILDELGSWLNSRTFADKSRQPVIDWLIHSRKKGWHVYFICQNIGQIDKQVRESLVEYVVRCSRLDRIKIPFVGWLLNTFNDRWGYLPRLHVATVRMGAAADGMVADRWYYQGDDLHAAYDTRQIFRDNYDCGPHSLLSAWHVKGRYLAPVVREPRWIALRRLVLCVGRKPGTRSSRFLPNPERHPLLEDRVKHPLVQLVMRLPAAQRVEHVRRLIQFGAI